MSIKLVWLQIPSVRRRVLRVGFELNFPYCTNSLDGVHVSFARAFTRLEMHVSRSPSSWTSLN